MPEVQKLLNQYCAVDDRGKRVIMRTAESESSELGSSASQIVFQIRSAYAMKAPSCGSGILQMLNPEGLLIRVYRVQASGGGLEVLISGPF